MSSLTKKLYSITGFDFLFAVVGLACLGLMIFGSNQQIVELAADVAPLRIGSTSAAS